MQFNYHVARSVKYTESFKYQGVVLTTELTHTADINTKLSRGRGTSRSLSKIFRSTALAVKLCVKLFQTLIMPIILHGSECWTLSRVVCDELNIFQLHCLRTILGVKWQDHVSNETVHSRCSVPMSSAQLVQLCRLGWAQWAGHVLHHDELIVHETVFSRVNSKRRVRHWTLVADLADDINHVCCFAVTSLPQNTKEFNDACSSFVAQAGDLRCFKCRSCAKPYISESWYRKHLSKCPEPTGAITGWTELRLMDLDLDLGTVDLDLDLDLLVVDLLQVCVYHYYYSQCWFSVHTSGYVIGHINEVTQCRLG